MWPIGGQNRVGPFHCFTVSRVISCSKRRNSSTITRAPLPRAPAIAASQAAAIPSGPSTTLWPLPEELITGFTTTGQPRGAAAAASSSALSA